MDWLPGWAALSLAEGDCLRWAGTGRVGWDDTSFLDCAAVTG